MTALDSKLEYISGLVAGIQADFAECTDEETPEDEHLLNLLQSYKVLLQGQKYNLPVTFDTHWLFKEAIRDAGALLENIANNAADKLTGWNTSIRPTKPTQEFVAMVSMIITELGKAVWNFETERPHLRKAFDRDRSEYAQRVAAQI